MTTIESPNSKAFRRIIYALLCSNTTCSIVKNSETEFSKEVINDVMNYIKIFCLSKNRYSCLMQYCDPIEGRIDEMLEHNAQPAIEDLKSKRKAILERVNGAGISLAKAHMEKELMQAQIRKEKTYIVSRFYDLAFKQLDSVLSGSAKQAKDQKEDRSELMLLHSHKDIIRYREKIRALWDFEKFYKEYYVVS